jgi:type II secretory ATPase GspE/PulE/Tfp pilus assembly ATPase PilB-like protein
MEKYSKKIVRQSQRPESGRRITGEIEISAATFEEIKKEVKNIPDFGREVEKFLNKRVTEILEIILGGAILVEASDIHIEPRETKARLRTRIDGLLQDVLTFKIEDYEKLLNRIKLLSRIKLNITDRPQDGRFSVLVEGKPIEIRASSLPAEHGESVVLRILNPKNLIDLDSLGLREDLFSAFKKEIKKPNGMIIVTGPTGSGKTTTLYAFLKTIQRPEIKIITIEDPIEYHLEGISQTQVNPSKGYDFATGLKAIVRQDPDVILVGEIRDLETAEIALQAALTGHLVFTTLHTNDAAGTIARLISLGSKASNIAPAINMAIAQRLVRKVCKKCSKMKKIKKEQLLKMKKEFKGAAKIIKIPQLTTKSKIPQAVGCKDCNYTGFRGRVGIFEAFFVDDEMEKFILTKPSIAALRERAVKRGMIPLKQDGLIKVLNGITTIEEVERVAGE